MVPRFGLSLYQLSTWIVPPVIAITFHEASHAWLTATAALEDPSAEGDAFPGDRAMRAARAKVAA